MERDDIEPKQVVGDDAATDDVEGHVGRMARKTRDAAPSEGDEATDDVEGHVGRMTRQTRMTRSDDDDVEGHLRS